MSTYQRQDIRKWLWLGLGLAVGITLGSAATLHAQQSGVQRIARRLPIQG